MKKQWFYCIHCERCFESDVPDDYDPEHAIEEIGQLTVDRNGEEWWRCPYEGCDGTPLDFWNWLRFRQQGHSECPTVPELNKVYPM